MRLKHFLVLTLLASLAHAQETGIVVSKLPASTGIQATDVTLDVIPGVLTQKATYGQVAAFVAANAFTAAPSTIQCNPSNSVSQVPSACASLPTGFTVDLASLSQSSNSDVLPVAYLPGTATTYVASGNLNIAGSATSPQSFVFNAGGAGTAYLPPIGANYVYPGGFQIIIWNEGAGLVSVDVATMGAGATLNGSNADVYIPQYGWMLVWADNTAAPGNYVAIPGGGFEYNSAGVAVWSNGLIAPGFIPDSPACGLTGTGRVASYTGGGLAFCTNGAGAASLDASGDFSVNGYLYASGIVTGTNLIPSSNAVSLTAGISLPQAHTLGLVGNNIASIVTTNLTSSALSSCGTSPSINATATDTKGTITEGTTATGCTLTFQTAYNTAPDCVVSSPSGVTPTSYTTSTTALTIVNASATGDKFTYLCIQ